MDCSPLIVVSLLPLTGHEGDPCLRSSDCSEGYCCARHFWTKICKPVLRQGEVCTKQRKKGSHGLEIFQRCDCAKGLSCKVWKDATSSSKSRLHMCQKIWSGGSCCRRRGLSLSICQGKFFKGWVVAVLKRSKRQRLTRDRTDCVGSSLLFSKQRVNGNTLMCLLWVVHPCTHIQICNLRLTHTHAHKHHLWYSGSQNISQEMLWCRCGLSPDGSKRCIRQVQKSHINNAQYIPHQTLKPNCS